MFVFSKRSRDNLKGVHPNLVKVIELALKLSEKDFMIIEGLRTEERQMSLKRQGHSQTLNSKHLVQSDGYGHAIDLVPYPVSWKLEDFYQIVEAVRKASKQLNINVRWGGAWVTLNQTEKTIPELIQEYSQARKRAGNKVFIDAPHFELI